MRKYLAPSTIIVATVLVLLGVLTASILNQDDNSKQSLASTIETSTTTTVFKRTTKLTSAPKPPKETTTTTKAEPSFKDTPEARQSVTACNKFRSTIRGLKDGTYTAAEMRSEFKEVNDRAIIATPAVQSAALLLFANSTSQDASGLQKAMVDMDKACSEAGH